MKILVVNELTAVGRCAEGCDDDEAGALLGYEGERKAAELAFVGEPDALRGYAVLSEQT